MLNSSSKRERGTNVIIDIHMKQQNGGKTVKLTEVQVHMNDIEAMAAAGWRRAHLSTYTNRNNR